MPVYRRHRLIHIHIPKTAGTAIGSYFDSQNDMPWQKDSLAGEEFRDGRWYEYQHLTLAEVSSISQSGLQGFHPFAVIRNPYERLLSDFVWRLSVDRNDASVQILRFESVREFIERIPEDINDEWERLILGADRAEANLLIHARPQHHYIHDRRGKRLVSDLLRFEYLRQDFNRLLGRYGKSTNQITRTTRRNVRKYFDRAMLDRVNEIYADDFALGAYEML